MVRSFVPYSRGWINVTSAHVAKELVSNGTARKGLVIWGLGFRPREIPVELSKLIFKFGFSRLFYFSRPTMSTEISLFFPFLLIWLPERSSRPRNRMELTKNRVEIKKDVLPLDSSLLAQIGCTMVTLQSHNLHRGIASLVCVPWLLCGDMKQSQHNFVIQGNRSELGWNLDIEKDKYKHCVDSKDALNVRSFRSL